MRAGLAGNVHAIKYWLATHGPAEWKEKAQVEVTDKRQRDIEQMTDAELEAELAEIDRRRALADECRASIAHLPNLPGRNNGPGSVH